METHTHTPTHTPHWSVSLENTDLHNESFRNGAVYVLLELLVFSEALQWV